MAPTQASKTSQSRTPAQDLQLPPPQTFDVLPALHELLARLDHTATEAANPLTEPSSPPESNSEVGALYTDQQPLEPKELPTEVLQIKARIRKALRELEKLPDMERSVDEQAMEIEELQGRIERQRGMLRGLGVVAEGMEGRVA